MAEDHNIGPLVFKSQFQLRKQACRRSPAVDHYDLEILDLDDDIWTTHTGNPVCCAAALATLRVIEEEGLVMRAKRLGHIIEDFARDNDLKAEGKGLIWAIHVQSAEQADRIVNQCAEKGLMMIKTRKPSVKIAPPLVITEADLKRGLEVIRQCIGHRD